MDPVVYARIKALCAERGIGITKLETELGLSPCTIGKWKGAVKPTLENIIKVTDYFHVSLDYLVGKTDIKTPINEFLDDSDIVTLQRAREKLSSHDKKRMMGILKLGFEEAFSETE